jgi:hypothetical protein
MLRACVARLNRCLTGDSLQEGRPAMQRYYAIQSRGDDGLRNLPTILPPEKYGEDR